MSPPIASALPDPTHWAIPAGLVAVAIFLVRAAWKDLRRPERVPDDAGPDPRVPLFRDTIGGLWLLCAITTGAWLLAGGDWAGLGFVVGAGWGTAAAWTVAVLAVGVLTVQWRSVQRSTEARESYAAQLSGATGYDWIRPTTPREYSHFRVMAVTAGFTEEVVFRGFLIGVLASWLPLWLAGGVALVLFVGGHVYQGLSGMVRLLPVSVVLTVLFLISGSLLPGVVVHTAVDVVGGKILWTIRDLWGRSPSRAAKSDDAGDPDGSADPHQPVRWHS